MNGNESGSEKKALMEKISSPLQEIGASYDVVVIGSGYGGSISASRLARAGQKVCLLERGNEILPGEYPETESEALPHFQVDAPGLPHVGSRRGLYDLRVNPDVSVLVGCGLGGTSLINANVSIKPDERVLKDDRWPKAIRANPDKELRQGYERSRVMLCPTPYPKTFPVLPKMAAHERSAKAMGKSLTVLDLNVTFQDGSSPAGVRQEKCKLCGNCVAGCNYLSKNTLLMNYLPDAKNHGAEIFCGAEVKYVERKGGAWVVHYDAGNGGPLEFVRATIVVLAAGTLGSTEILLRSKKNGLSLSPTLGDHFSGNGDMLSFAYDCEDRIEGLGHPGPGEPHVGPTITSSISLPDPADPARHVLLQEGAIPSPLVSFAESTLFWVALAEGVPVPSPLGIHEAALHTQTYLVMSSDDGAGQIVLDHGESDRVRIHWPTADSNVSLTRGNEEAKRAAEALGGGHIRGRQMITVHPLGGCAMADDASKGVVDDRCRVFSGQEGSDVHKGLYVCDGSVIPMPLGVNPLWTICAIAERACHYMAEERGLHIDYSLPSAKPPPPPAPTTVGVKFHEEMTGFFMRGVTGESADPLAGWPTMYRRGYAEGEAHHSPFALLADIEAEDVDALVNAPDHAAKLVGTVIAPALSPDPMMATGGVFNLLTRDGPDPDTRFMRYRATLTAQRGERYYLNGFKRVGGGSILHAWRDTTTLHITVHEGPGEAGPVIGKGIIRIGPLMVAALLASMRAVNARGLFARAGAVLKLNRYFLRTVIKAYWGL